MEPENTSENRTEETKEQKIDYISIDDFKKVKAQLGKVVVAEAVADSDKLIRFEIDFGTETRQILSAIREWYTEPEKLIGKTLLFCTNLAPRMIRGYESNGMLMAVDGVDGTPVFLVPDESFDKEITPGASMR